MPTTHSDWAATTAREPSVRRPQRHPHALLPTRSPLTPSLHPSKQTPPSLTRTMCSSSSSQYQAVSTRLRVRAIPIHGTASLPVASLQYEHSCEGQRWHSTLDTQLTRLPPLFTMPRASSVGNVVRGSRFYRLGRRHLLLVHLQPPLPSWPVLLQLSLPRLPHRQAPGGCWQSNQRQELPNSGLRPHPGRYQCQLSGCL